jgi:hypothetical protein
MLQKGLTLGECPEAPPPPGGDDVAMCKSKRGRQKTIMV